MLRFAGEAQFTRGALRDQSGAQLNPAPLTCSVLTGARECPQILRLIKAECESQLPGLRPAAHGAAMPDAEPETSRAP